MANIGKGLRVAQTALSTSATLVLSAWRSRAFCEIKNTDASISVYVGPSGVTSSTGHLLKAGEAIGFENYVGPIYVVAASGTPTVTSVEW